MAKSGNFTARRTVVVCIIVAIIVIAPFLSVFLTGVCLPSVYDDTYYGALPVLYDRLKNTEGKKVIALGNSAVAFGVDSALAESLLEKGGLDYSFCNFGLYGALGTKMMCELAFDYIDEGDIVVLAPELLAQSLSLYFSAEHAWYALDGDMSMFSHFSSETKRSLVGGFFSYTAKKFALFDRGKKAAPSGVYARASFDKHGDLKNFARPYNIMDGGVGGSVRLDEDLFGDEFVEYVNDYARSVRDRGARIYFAFSPMNAYAMSESDLARADEFYGAVQDKLDFDILGDLSSSVMEGEWFYDSDYHLNESGMTVYTVGLVNGIKNALGNTTKTECVMPEKPIAPDPDIEGEGDNTHAGMFVYERDGNYYDIVGLTDAGKKAQELIVPYRVDGLFVKSIAPEVFSGNAILRSVTVQKNIRRLSDGCFDGCSALEKIILLHDDPTDIGVGYGLLDGTPASCVVCVPASALGMFENNYFWGKYAARLESI